MLNVSGFGFRVWSSAPGSVSGSNLNNVSVNVSGSISGSIPGGVSGSFSGLCFRVKGLGFKN